MMPPILENGKDFFSKFGKHEVVYVTVALENDGLVQALSERRALLQRASFKRIEETISLEQLQEMIGLHQHLALQETETDE
mmetsp:Transcript_19235/g.34825  ORF Transcript_19235/g.34825 Transcript_19235/m.34825 type:complete len:81 (+) Transcript_19235:923-1165(+)